MAWAEVGLILKGLMRIQRAEGGRIVNNPVVYTLALNLLEFRQPTMKQSLNLDDMMSAVRFCAAQMDSQYGDTVFDEWVVISLKNGQPRILHYFGPRNYEFRQNFTRDLGALRNALFNGNHRPGDFEFARHAKGTYFEAFMALGNDVYLICNNTRASMDEIAQNPRWLSAQVPFADLSEKICASSLETQQN